MHSFFLIELWTEKECKIDFYHKIMFSVIFITFGLISGIWGQIRVGSRAFVSAHELRWPGGIVPYELSPKFSPAETFTILTALESISTQTCVIFTPHETEKDFLSIKVLRGHSVSWSSFGHTTGEQVMHLASSAAHEKSSLETGIVLYHLMKVLGFHSEHRRPDRDQYVDIEWDNIKKEKLHTFIKLAKNEFIYDVDRESYDFSSLMHPNTTKFAKDSKIPVILPKFQVHSVIGQRAGLSDGDVRKILDAYDCPKENNKSNSDEMVTKWSCFWMLLFVYFV